MSAEVQGPAWMRRAWLPAHWQETLDENPQAIVGLTEKPDDADEWVEVLVIEKPEVTDD